MSRRKEVSSDDTEERVDCRLLQTYPFALVLRMRVVQIVCGISTVLMGAVAMIEEKSNFNMGFGIPTGLLTVLAAANSIYFSRGFDGYQPPSCNPSSRWSRLKFLGPTFKIASIHVVLWGVASVLLFLLSFKAAKTLSLDINNSPTLAILAAVEFLLSLIVIMALLLILRIDIHYDPD